MELNSIHLGNCLNVLCSLPDNSVDAIVTDPPYELCFMSKKWDRTGIAFNMRMWEQCMRVLKPGGHLLAFGATRTSHRMTCAIEDAGFEIRDNIIYAYGVGFPKSLNVGKKIDKLAGAERQVISEGVPVKRIIPGADQDKTGSWIKDNGRTFTPTITGPATHDAKKWDGWGTQLKPAYENITCARKPLSEKTIVANVLKWGTGGINIDACRVPLNSDYKCKANGRPSQTGLGDNYIPELANKPDTVGRFPANIITDGSDVITELFPQSKSTVGYGKRMAGTLGKRVYGKFAQRKYVDLRNDSGSAARFFKVCEFTEEEREYQRLFYTPKPSTKERNMGCEELENGNIHPTLKPLSIMKYLITLVTPPNGVVLDPFAGSGTTLIAAKQLGFNFIGIELNEDYIKIAEARIASVKDVA